MKTIKSSLLLTLSLAIMAVWSSCDTIGTKVDPSGKVTSNTLAITGVRGISVSDAFSVKVLFSDSVEKVEIRANENLHKFIEVSKRGDELNIEVVKGVSITGNATLEAVVTTNSLHKMDASGASRIQVMDTLFADLLRVDLSGASLVNALVEANTVVAGLSGASHLELAGSTELMELDMSGASVTEGYSFEANDFEGHFSGASTAKVSIHHSIRLDASGASSLKYKGNASVTHQDLSGGSSIQKVP